MIDKRTKKSVVNKVSFSVRAGEIVCIAGIDGNGQTELAGALVGLINSDSGQILMGEEEWSHRSIRYRNTHGFAHIPEDRQKIRAGVGLSSGEKLRDPAIFRAGLSASRIYPPKDGATICRKIDQTI